MKAVLICTDKPGALPIRVATRDAHLAYIAETGVVELAGPLLGEDGNPNGSMIVLEVPDMEAARAWAAGDPYARAGLFERVTFQGWRRVVG